VVAPRAASLGERVDQAGEALAKRLGARPRVVWIAEGGLGPAASRVDAGSAVDASALKGFGRDAPGRFAWMRGADGLVAFEGGALLADGARAEEVGLPAWIARRAGAEIAIVTGGAGALEPAVAAPSILGVEDHVNFAGLTPLRAPLDEKLGPRFPDLAQAYDEELLARAERIAARLGVPFRRGVLAATAGPSLETHAERAFLRGAGAHAVAQSIVVPVIAAAHAGLRTLALAGIVEGVKARRAYADPAAMARAAAAVAEQTARVVLALAEEAA